MDVRDRDLERLATLVASSTLVRDAEAVILGGSFANGNPAYVKRGDSLKCLSDFDLIVIGSLSKAEGDALGVEIDARTGIPASVGVLDSEDLSSRPPSQFWWELANNGIVLLGSKHRVDERLSRFKATPPGKEDAKRVIVNRFAELSTASGTERRGVAGLRCLQAAVDAWLAVDGAMPADLSSRWDLAGSTWPDEVAILRAFTCRLLVHSDECATWANAGKAALFRAAHLTKGLENITKPRDFRTELANHRLLVSHGVAVLGYPLEASIHRLLAQSVLCRRDPSARVLKAWSLIHRGRLPGTEEAGTDES